MKVTVYCTEKNKTEIGKIAAADLHEPADFVTYEELRKGDGALIADHELVNTLRKDEAAGYSPVYIYFKNRLFDISQADQLVEEDVLLWRRKTGMARRISMKCCAIWISCAGIQ